MALKRYSPRRRLHQGAWEPLSIARECGGPSVARPWHLRPYVLDLNVRAAHVVTTDMSLMRRPGTWSETYAALESDDFWLASHYRPLQQTLAQWKAMHLPSQRFVHMVQAWWPHLTCGIRPAREAARVGLESWGSLGAEDGLPQLILLLYLCHRSYMKTPPEQQPFRTLLETYDSFLRDPSTLQPIYPFFHWLQYIPPCEVDAMQHVVRAMLDDEADFVDTQKPFEWRYLAWDPHTALPQSVSEREKYEIARTRSLLAQVHLAPISMAQQRWLLDRFHYVREILLSQTDPWTKDSSAVHGWAFASIQIGMHGDLDVAGGNVAELAIKAPHIALAWIRFTCALPPIFIPSQEELRSFFVGLAQRMSELVRPTQVVDLWSHLLTVPDDVWVFGYTQDPAILRLCIPMRWLVQALSLPYFVVQCVSRIDAALEPLNSMEVPALCMYATKLLQKGLICAQEGPSRPLALLDAIQIYDEDQQRLSPEDLKSGHRRTLDHIQKEITELQESLYSMLCSLALSQSKHAYGAQLYEELCTVRRRSSS